MTAPARLLSVRLQGFKSFAERTHVAFGPGISAVVGPNGSGKSNLADALRWALGEQGRALRTRKSEDVIWAGSERRPAQGMADVQLVLDNGDGLLPVDYAVVELGRRLFRSGENEYVLNRQKVRLRDLVDLLDAAHLAENAFLFIGQGMVDQALALRPEERRPLFEEVAGVRRHERRRRKAEEQLAESEANLARVGDILAELRPQVRRLAAQAEQQASRRDAGDDLATALLTAARARWFEAAGRVAAAASGLAAASTGLDVAMTTLGEREADAAGIAERLTARALTSAEGRGRLEAARERLTGLRLRAGALESELAGLDRDAERLVGERAATEADLAVQRQRATTPIPSIDATIEADLAAADLALAGATHELAAVRQSADLADAEAAANRRAEAARAAELESATRRLAELEREALDEGQRAAAAIALGDQRAIEHAEARIALAGAGARVTGAMNAVHQAETALATAEAQVRTGTDAVASLDAATAATRGNLEAVQSMLADLDAGSFAAAARSRGGHRINADLIIDPALRGAVEAALGGAGAAFVVSRAGLLALDGEHGAAVAAESLARPDDDGAPDGRTGTAFLERVRALRGGALRDAIRRDGRGAVRRLLARAVWLPDLAACLDIQADLPAGWIAVPRDGRNVVGPLGVSLGSTDSALRHRADAQRLEAELERLERERATAGSAHDLRVATLDASRADLATARAHLDTAGDERRRAEQEERDAGRVAETAGREAAWLEAQMARLTGSLERARVTAAAAEAAVKSAAAPGRAAPGDAASNRATATAGDGPSGLERRVADLRDRRDQLAATRATAEQARREAERFRAGAEAGVAIGQRRIAEIDASILAAETRRADLERSRRDLTGEVAAATAVVGEAGARVDELVAADNADRERLGGAERAAAAAREALRSIQDGARGAEREELEARLGLEALREGLLVELAGLGELGFRHLGAEMPTPTADGTADAETDAEGDLQVEASVEDLEAALTAAAASWAALAPTEEVPSPARLASLRRRFHELGAANPFALEEHAELAARLAGLESQRTDLEGAITRTRGLIAELDSLIATQFESTFAKLERAFDARFRQLFGGGFARLSLTEPGDLGTTGIEITARPPGKKPQALAMLSGGERALTAVALLFSMLEVRPVPFCVLDEVDAALDEANIGRFTDALRELSRQTQCIVITHNRGTIETADALYGVTVDEDSVSRVISLRLDEATAIAERAVVGRVLEPAAG